MAAGGLAEELQPRLGSTITDVIGAAQSISPAIAKCAENFSQLSALVLAQRRQNRRLKENAVRSGLKGERRRQLKWLASTRKLLLLPSGM